MAAYYNDIDPYCCRVLRKQIAAGHLPPGDVDERDIREVPASDLVGYDQIHLFAGIGGIPLGLRWGGVPDDFNILTAGFPCTDISNAGNKAGIAGKRSGLWSEAARIIRAIRPGYILVENVQALLARGFGAVLGDLAACGYDAEWDCLPAAAFGAPHIRYRVFVVAYTDHPGQPILSLDGKEWSWVQTRDRREAWLLQEPAVAGVGNGTAGRMDRRRALGDTVVPAQARFIGERIMEVSR